MDNPRPVENSTVPPKPPRGQWRSDVTLTPERQAELPAFEKKWLDIARDTKRGDPVAAWEHMKAIYEYAGEPAPKYMVWCVSPWGMCAAAAALSILPDYDTPPAPEAPVAPPPAVEYKDTLTDPWRTAIAFENAARACRAVLAQVHGVASPSDRDIAPLMRQLFADGGAELVRRTKEDYLQYWRSWWSPGVADVWWLHMYDVLQEYCDWEDMHGFRGLADHCFTAITSPEWVLLCDKPTINHIGDDGVPSHLDAPAIGFADGYGIFSFQGVTLPPDMIVNPEGLTAQRIMAEENAEVRRVMMRKFGEGRFVEEIGAAVIDRHDDYILYKADLPDDEPLVMVRMNNSTPMPGTGLQWRSRYVGPPEKEAWAAGQPALQNDPGWYAWEQYDTGVPAVLKPYWRRVAPHHTRAIEAIASTFAMTAAEYVLSEES